MASVVCYQFGVAVNIDMRRIEAVFRTQPPVTFDLAVNTARCHVRIEEPRGNIFLKGRQFAISNEDEEHALRF